MAVTQELDLFNAQDLVFRHHHPSKVGPSMRQIQGWNFKAFESGA